MDIPHVNPKVIYPNVNWERLIFKGVIDYSDWPKKTGKSF